MRNSSSPLLVQLTVLSCTCYNSNRTPKYPRNQLLSIVLPYKPSSLSPKQPVYRRRCRCRYSNRRFGFLSDVGHVALPQSSLLTTVRVLLRPFSSKSRIIVVVCVHLGLLVGVGAVQRMYTYIVDGSCSCRVCEIGTYLMVPCTNGRVYKGDPDTDLGSTVPHVY